MLLKKGSTGLDVRDLQIRLGLGSDGIFGLNTEAKVKEWQVGNDLVADGIVGPKTWKLLFPDHVESGDLGHFTTKETIDKLQAVLPTAVVCELRMILASNNKDAILTPLRLAHFIAQCAHESASFTLCEENLNYSALGLMKTFRSHFKNMEECERYAHKPESIANHVYANRLGNGCELSGDGWKYRGRGYIQITGKENYYALEPAIEDDLIAEPELVATHYRLISAAIFFKHKRIGFIADKGCSKNIVTEVTKCVNGGCIGLAERIALFKKFYSVITGVSACH